MCHLVNVMVDIHLSNATELYSVGIEHQNCGMGLCSGMKYQTKMTKLVT